MSVTPIVAEHRADHSAPSAEQTGPAEHHRGDHVEFETAAGVGCFAGLGYAGFLKAQSWRAALAAA